MLKSLLDGIMERRAAELLAQIRDWLPTDGPILDLGSGTGHFSHLIEQELRVDVVTADVSDMHVVGRAPVLVNDGPLPFPDRSFSAALLIFMLAYPSNPAAVLTEAARVSRGPVVLIQSLYSGRFGHAWHRGREFIWTVVAFHVSRIVGYVPADAKFSMHTRRFYTQGELESEVRSARLRILAQRERAVLPGRALVVAALMLEADD